MITFNFLSILILTYKLALIVLLTLMYYLNLESNILNIELKDTLIVSQLIKEQPKQINDRFLQ